MRVEEIKSGTEQRYKVIKPLGKGGQGKVYLVKDLHVKCFRAMKITDKSTGEAQTLLKWSHKSLPTVVDVINLGEKTGIIMEYIEGVTLETYVRKQGALSEKQAAAFGTALLEILCLFHACRPAVIYGDMKPENIMITRERQLKLIDFGSCFRDTPYETKRERTATMGYGAPELFLEGKGIHGIKSDFYSFGQTLLFMMTGVSPMERHGNSFFHEMKQKKLSFGMQAVIRRCLEEKPEKRYQSAEKCLWDLKHYKQLGLWYGFYGKFLHLLCRAGTFASLFLLLKALWFCYFEQVQEQRIFAAAAVVLAMIIYTIHCFLLHRKGLEYRYYRQEISILKTEKEYRGLFLETCEKLENM